MHFRMLTAAGAALLLAGACSDRTVVSPTADPALRSVTSVDQSPPAPWARVVTGRTGPASVYALYIPTDWNGDAVFYAHGIRSPLDPVGFDDTQDNIQEVRDALGTLGYAIAYSSFDDNGLAVKDGAERTHQLRGLLASELHGQPNRSFLLGYSLGGAVALDLAESYPKQYDGLLTMCGMVGGSQLELQYIGDVRALFDFYYPGILPGNVTSVPGPAPALDDVTGAVVGAIAANPLGLFAIASTAQTPLAYAPVGTITDPSSAAFQSLAQSLITALYYQLLAAPSVETLTHGHSPYGNRGVTYTMGTPVVAGLSGVLAPMIAASNAGVTRYDIAPDARNYLDKYYTPTGHLRFPVVSVHNLWDPLVPYFHEPAFAAIVQTAGSSDLLLQRSIPNYSHCDFPTPLVVGSFQTMVDWVNTGVKPAN
jgi:pimeloyl-ACP methyl ester carboxylesterase